MTLQDANVNWQGIPRNEMKFSDIEDEFGLMTNGNADQNLNMETDEWGY